MLNYIKSTVLAWSILLTGGFGLLGVAAQTVVDPHLVYELRCSGCHTQHARDFVHDHLINLDGEVIGRKSGREVGAFLEAGHGLLGSWQIEAIVAHFKVIQKSGSLFYKKCFSCHGRAVEFARKQLAIVDGKLIGRRSQRDIEAFLGKHGRLEPDEIAKMITTLKRQLEGAKK